MNKTEKKRTLNKEITKFAMVTSAGAIVLFGTVMLVLFFVLFKGNIRKDMEYMLKNTGQQYQDKIQFIEDGALSIRHNVILKDFFGQKWSDRDEMETQLSYCMELFSERNMVDQQMPFVVSVCLFNNREEYLKKHYYPMTVAGARNKELVYQNLQKKFRRSTDQYAVYTGEEEINLCFRVLDDGMNEIGICVIGIGKDALEKTFEGISGYSHGSWAVFSEKNGILDAYGEADFKENLQELETNDSGEVKIQGTPAIFHYVTAGFGMNAAVCVGMDNIYDILKPTMLTFLAILLLALIFVATFTLGISRRFTKPLKKMGDSLAAFGQKNFDVRMEDSPIQEIHEISQVFNEMTERIKYLIEQVYEKQLLATQAQVKYLQAQINPHFQFNILAMFSVNAKLAGNEELYQGLRAFSKLMQGKIFREKEIMIPVSEEMELVNFYLYLQKSRFGEALSYDIHFGSEDIKNMLIPRLLIEPLVENAVSHGIEPKSGNGNVTVELSEEDGRLHIVVTDDGVGFEAAECLKEKEKQENLDTLSHTHTGLENTRRLLQILYDDRYDMKIQGEKGVGTKVEIILPVEGGICNVEGCSGR